MTKHKQQVNDDKMWINTFIVIHYKVWNNDDECEKEAPVGMGIYFFLLYIYIYISTHNSPKHEQWVWEGGVGGVGQLYCFNSPHAEDFSEELDHSIGHLYADDDFEISLCPYGNFILVLIIFSTDKKLGL